MDRRHFGGQLYKIAIIIPAYPWSQGRMGVAESSLTTSFSATRGRKRKSLGVFPCSFFMQKRSFQPFWTKLINIFFTHIWSRPQIFVGSVVFLAKLIISIHWLQTKYFLLSRVEFEHKEITGIQNVWRVKQTIDISSGFRQVVEHSTTALFRSREAMGDCSEAD